MQMSKRIPSYIPLILPVMVLILGSLLTNYAMAEGTVDEEITPYQSSFEGYKKLTDESRADWKTLNNQIAPSEKSMPGMSENSDMTNMPGMDMGETSRKSSGTDMSQMKGMDHSKMQGMDMGDKNATSKNADMTNMPGMDMGETSAKFSSTDMSQMKGMDHSKMQSMPSTSKPENSDMSTMKGMDHSAMQGMNMEKSTTKPDSSDMSEMPGMGVDNSNTKSGSVEMSNMESMSPASKSDMSSMEGMDHTKMKMTNAVSASKDTQGFQIIPNFHPFAVHFPIVLIIIAFLFSLAASVLRKHPIAIQLASTGHFSLWLAAPAAVVAALFGWLAFNAVNHDDAGHAAMLLHRAWAIPTAISILLLASWDLWKNRSNQITSVPIVLILGLLSGATLVTGWLGGEVVYRHGIGVMSIPANGVSKDSGHEHGGPKADEPVSSPVKSAPSTEGESHEH